MLVMLLLYSEVSHKITNIIPLNFLQHVDEEQIYESYSYCTASLYHHNVVNTNTPTVKKRGRPPKCAIEKQDRNAKTNVSMVKQAIKRQIRQIKLSTTILLPSLTQLQFL